MSTPPASTTSLVLAEFAEHAGIVVLPLVLICGLVALSLSAIAPFVRSEDVLGRLGYAVLGLALAVGAAWLALYASGPDVYHDYSRWEHAARWGKTPVVAAAISTAAAASIGSFATALTPPRGVVRIFVALAAASSCLFLLVAWFFLTGGH